MHIHKTRTKKQVQNFITQFHYPAVALKEEVDAQVRQAAGSNIFASASFVDKACFDGLPASARKELGKCTGCEHFEWRKLADERQRIRIDAESRSQVCPV